MKRGGFVSCVGEGWGTAYYMTCILMGDCVKAERGEYSGGRYMGVSLGGWTGFGSWDGVTWRVFVYFLTLGHASYFSRHIARC